MKLCPLWLSLVLVGWTGGDLPAWLGKQSEVSWNKLIANISPRDAAKGTVVAAQSRSKPDYYYHWTRDAGLVMDVLRQKYEGSSDAEFRRNILEKFDDYVALSSKHQSQNSMSGPAWGMGMAEPKYFVDGRPFDGPWGRPQTDGPAIRATTLIQMANVLADGGISRRWYDSQMPSYSVIKADLEFTAANWKQPSFDLWEEVLGDHFYTRMVQRKSLLLGGKLATKSGDHGAAKYYLEQAREIEKTLEEFWNPQDRLLEVSRNELSGISYKDSRMDAAVVLAALHGSLDDGFFAPWDSRVLVSLARIADVFKDIYSINRSLVDRQGNYLAAAIGRYPEDKYDGQDSQDEANPWFLTTAGFAEALYVTLEHWKKVEVIDVDENLVEFLLLLCPDFQPNCLDGKKQVLKSDPLFALIEKMLLKKADGFLNRVRMHAGATGALSEQFNRYSGKQRGASELTWSHAALLTAQMARVRASGD